jgi:hypothetical protein
LLLERRLIVAIRALLLKRTFRRGRLLEETVVVAFPEAALASVVRHFDSMWTVEPVFARGERLL